MTEKTTALSSRITQQNLALFAIFVGVGAIAFSPIFVRLSDLGPNAVAFWRLALATPLLWAWTATSGKGQVVVRPDNRRAYLWLLVPGIFFAGDLMLWHAAIGLTSVANATFLPNLAPLIVTLVAWQWLGERLKPVFAVGLVAALVGLGLMVLASAGRGESNLLGDLLATITALFYAGYILSIKQLRKQYNAATILLSSALIGIIILFVATLASGESFLPGDWRGWLVLLGLAWFSHVGGQGLITYALAHLPASFSSVTMLMQPVLAALFAWLLLGEAMAPLQAAGGALVILGILLARRGSGG
jgi:drug/metabolite transporter (DMT)-like permease